MTNVNDIVLDLHRVNRIYPRDIADTPTAILREMLLPKGVMFKPGPDSFFALQDISFRLLRGQKLGVIGTHRSGKTSLAGIASGVLSPTSGSVFSTGRRMLISRPTAGFKPTLTTLENLRIRASLAGLHGEHLDTVLKKTLSLCGVEEADARIPMGNLSPYLIKQLGLTLLLELPADMLVIDEISSAGIGDARWLTRGLLKEKLEASTALVISSDLSFIQEVATEAIVLHQGKMYGPFSVENALNYYDRLSDFSSSTSDIETDPFTEDSHDSFVPEDGINIQQNKSKSTNLSTWTVSKIEVDGSHFQHAHHSLIRHPGDSVNVDVELTSTCNQIYSGGLFVLHGGNSGLEVGRCTVEVADTNVKAKQKLTLRFTLKVPDWQEFFYGLTFSPRDSQRNFTLYNRKKILILGVIQKTARLPARELEIFNCSIKMENT